MLFHRLPITPSSGSGIHAGQNTGAWIRFARRCQPAEALAGQRTVADAFTESFAPHPASANAARARTPSRLIASLKRGEPEKNGKRPLRPPPQLADQILTARPDEAAEDERDDQHIVEL